MIKVWLKSFLMISVLSFISRGVIVLFELPENFNTLFALLTGITVYGGYTAPELDRVREQAEKEKQNNGRNKDSHSS